VVSPVVSHHAFSIRIEGERSNIYSGDQGVDTNWFVFDDWKQTTCFFKRHGRNSGEDSDHVT
jgi:hypothetical protein